MQRWRRVLIIEKSEGLVEQIWAFGDRGGGARGEETGEVAGLGLLWGRVVE